MGGQTSGETMGYDIASVLVPVLIPIRCMPSGWMDTIKLVDVIDCYRRKRELIEQKRGPVLIDVLTYRYGGHSPSDASYRSKEEVEAWEKQRLHQKFSAKLIESGIATQTELDEVWANVKETMVDVYKLVVMTNFLHVWTHAKIRGGKHDLLNLSVDTFAPALTR
ncbi:hypothetical protein MASR1M31_20320 [Porphyromonadaceae bacterium]